MKLKDLFFFNSFSKFSMVSALLEEGRKTLKTLEKRVKEKQEIKLLCKFAAQFHTHLEINNSTFLHISQNFSASNDKSEIFKTQTWYVYLWFS